MRLWVYLGAAAALSVERACYVWIARAPQVFRRVCARPAVAWLGEPIAVVRALFCGFKGLQILVFAWWCYVHGDGSLAPGNDALGLALGSALIVAGQGLNFSVFYRLGSVAVFYGDRLGYEISWSRAFPFCVLSHPQ